MISHHTSTCRNLLPGESETRLPISGEILSNHPARKRLLCTRNLANAIHTCLLFDHVFQIDRLVWVILLGFVSKWKSKNVIPLDRTKITLSISEPTLEPLSKNFIKLWIQFVCITVSAVSPITRNRSSKNILPSPVSYFSPSKETIVTVWPLNE